jgi:hypothetical protein
MGSTSAFFAQKLELCVTFTIQESSLSLQEFFLHLFRKCLDDQTGAVSRRVRVPELSALRQDLFTAVSECVMVETKQARGLALIAAGHFQGGFNVESFH